MELLVFTNEKKQIKIFFFDGILNIQNIIVLLEFIAVPPKKNYFNLCIDIYAHYKIGNGYQNSVLGEKKNEKLLERIYQYINIDACDAEEVTFAFIDSDKQDNNNNNNKKNYIL